jgi:hypothetical protein
MLSDRSQRKHVRLGVYAAKHYEGVVPLRSNVQRQFSKEPGSSGDAQLTAEYRRRGLHDASAQINLTRFAMRGSGHVLGVQ